MATIDQIVRRHLSFTEGPPGHISRATQQLDREVCREATCSECGQHGMEYRPFSRDRSYVALAVCPQCGHSEEV